MRRSVVLHLLLVASLASACAPARGSASPGASGPSPPESVTAAASTSPAARIPLPSGFPVPPGALPVPLPSDDPGLIGLWSSDRVGSAAYDFYLRALPDAGYRIVAVYPGGAAALIRFGLAGGAIWQLVLHAGPNETVAIEVRLDRP